MAPDLQKLDMRNYAALRVEWMRLNEERPKKDRNNDQETIKDKVYECVRLNDWEL